MLKFEADEIKVKPGRKAPTLRPAHGGGANFKGRGLKRYSVPGGRAVNQQNPYIRGQGNALTGRIIDPHDSDDSTPIAASVNNGNAHAGFDVLTVRTAFRRAHGLNTSRQEFAPIDTTLRASSIRSKMKSRSFNVGDIHEDIDTPLNVPTNYREYDGTVRFRDNVNNVSAPRSETVIETVKIDPETAWNRHTAMQDALLAQIAD